MQLLTLHTVGMDVSVFSRLRDDDLGFFGGNGIAAALVTVLAFAAAEGIDRDAVGHVVRLTTSTPPPQQAHSYNSVTEYTSLLDAVTPPTPPLARFSER